MTSNFWTRLLTLSVLAAMLVALPSAAAQRQRNHNCEQRVRQAELNLQRAIQRHGVHSRQAEQKRRALRNVQHRCGSI